MKMHHSSGGEWQSPVLVGPGYSPAKNGLSASPSYSYLQYKQLSNDRRTQRHRSYTGLVDVPRTRVISVRQALYAWSTEQGHIVLSIYTTVTATRINITHHQQPQISVLRHMRQT